MKRSEFKKWLDGGLRYGFSDDPEETIIAKVEEIAGPVQWEPEGSGLPKALYLSNRIMSLPHTTERLGWYIRDAEGGVAPLAICEHEGWVVSQGSPRTPESLLKAMVEAYNKEREQGPAAEKLLGRYREIVRKAIADLEGVLADPRAE